MSTDRPDIGTLVLDAGRDLVGYVMGHAGQRIRLRPPVGDAEWDCPLRDVRPAGTLERLRAAVCVVNAQWLP
ncbi:hypothetical protein [Streptomyces sp. NPDC051569]|uniref:hypothetical protein n=1 Tax=Streptomyces sp. NPDC051569 TaxID=3365661 RepID=UPI00378D7C85